jgi:hypothetical protein
MCPEMQPRSWVVQAQPCNKTVIDSDVAVSFFPLLAGRQASKNRSSNVFLEGLSSTNSKRLLEFHQNRASLHKSWFHVASSGAGEVQELLPPDCVMTVESESTVGCVSLIHTVAVYLPAGVCPIAHDPGFKAPGFRPHPLPSATTKSCIAQGSRSQ